LRPSRSKIPAIPHIYSRIPLSLTGLTFSSKLIAQSG
jgi:hypothetical protein